MFVCLFRPVLLSKCVCVLSRECVAEDFLSLRHKYLKGLGDRLRSGPDSPNKERNSLFLCPSKLLEYCCWLGGRMSQYKDVHCFFSEQRLEQCIMGRMLVPLLLFSGAALVILDDVAPKN